jgi:hypothetical protein
VLSMFLSPEAIDEAGRIRGGFVALTGFSKENGPEIVGVLQPGGSNFPGLYLRAYLSFGQVQLVGEAEGVSMFQERRRVYMKAQNPGAPAFKEQNEGPVMARTPGGLVFGSSVGVVKDLLRRARGKDGDASLASVRAYKDAAALRQRPGLFAYADVAALSAHLDEWSKSPRPGFPFPWGTWKTVLRPETMRSVTASLTLQNGNLEWQVRANLTGKGDSPLLGLLPDKPAPRELLHFVPADAMLALTAGTGDGEQRWKTFLNLLDELAKLGGEREANLPSRKVREREENARLQVGKDVLAVVTGAALVVEVGEGRDRKDRDRPRSPMLVLRAADAGAARGLEERGLPKLLGLMADGPAPAPTQEEVDGQRISRVAADKVPGRMPLHYGRKGAVLVLGPDRKRVAEALAAGARKQGLLGEAKVAAALQDVDASAVAVGVVPPERSLTELFTYLGTPAPVMKRVGPPGAPAPAPPPPRKEAPPGLEKSLKDLRKAVEPLPPLVFSLSRQPESVVLELRQTGLRRVAPRVLDVWVESILQRTLPGAGFGMGVGGRAAAEEAARQAEMEARRALQEAQRQADKAAEARKKREQEKKR